MVEHNWIDFSVSNDDIGIAWCPFCGTLRREFFGEEDPYEYFSMGSEPERGHAGQAIGKTDAPRCQQKSIE